MNSLKDICQKHLILVKREISKKRKKIIENIAVIVILCLCSIIICMQSPTNIWENREAGTDSSVFRYIAFLISKGNVIYRDMFDHKGPLLYLINYIGMRISYYRGIWGIEVLFMIVTILGIYKISRISCGKIFSCLTVFITMTPIFLYFEGGNLPEEYSLPFIVCGLYIFLEYFLFRKISRYRLILCGIAFSCVCMIRINMISVWLVFSLAVLIENIKEKRVKETGSYLLWFLVGSTVILVPIVVYLFVNRALKEFIQDYIIFNFQYIGTAQVPNSKVLSYVTFIDTDIMILSLGIVFYKLLQKQEERKYLYWTYAIFMICTIYLTCMSGRIFKHYGMGLIPIFAFPVSLLFGYCERHFLENKLAYLISYFFIVAALPPWMEQIQESISMYHTKDNSAFSAELSEAITVIKNNSSENDKIIVYGNHDIIYVLSQRLAASKYSYQMPISEISLEIKEEFFRELHMNIPKLVVLQKTKDNSLIFEFIQEYDYQLICENNSYLIYRMT